MKAYSSKLPKDYPIAIKPMGEIAGYPVRPGLFDINGVTVLPRGVNFTMGIIVSFSCFTEERRSRMQCFRFRMSTRLGMCTR